jgi:hypothetical protein
LVDLDRDGRTDVLSGSWPGEIYFFRRQPDGCFARGQQLKGPDGKPINLGSGSSAFSADWDGDGKLDLIVGTVLGQVHLLPGAGKGRTFGQARRLVADGKPIAVNGDAAPVVADWDGDGRHDLIVGAEDGSVVWHRNTGTAREPKLAPARTLIGKSPAGWNGDDSRGPTDWGLRVKPCVADWDGDGRLDLLLGDRCGSFNAKPDQTEKEKAEEIQANDRLPDLRARWAATFRAYRKAGNAPEGETSPDREARLARREQLRERLTRFKDEIVVVQEIQARYRPGRQSHGFVWLFLRKPQEKGR